MGRNLEILNILSVVELLRVGFLTTEGNEGVDGFANESRVLVMEAE